MPDYDQKTLYEIENRYFNEAGRMEVMAVRRVLEKVLHSTNSSGYRFLFSLKHLKFFIARVEVDKNLADLTEKVDGKGSTALIPAIRGEIGKIISDQFPMEKAHNLSYVNAVIFQRIRNEFGFPIRVASLMMKLQ